MVNLQPLPLTESSTQFRGMLYFLNTKSQALCHSIVSALPSSTKQTPQDIHEEEEDGG